MPQHPETDACYAENVSNSSERSEIMRPEGLRQSDRVSFRMPVEASWVNGSGAESKQKAETMLVSRNGGVLRLKEKFFTGRELTIRRQREGDHWKVAKARIVAEIDQDADGYLYAIAMLDPRADFWDIDFPAPQSDSDQSTRSADRHAQAERPARAETWNAAWMHRDRLIIRFT